jgi:hypothetical protein
MAALFDREVNVRRAACAAYQENVGRQGADAFPNGIAISTHADYFSVANRAHAFTNVALYVAQFSDYRYRFVDHLCRVKLAHWHAEIRALAAAAIAKLAAVEKVKEYVAENTIPQMVTRAACRMSRAVALPPLAYVTCMLRVFS